MALFTDGNPADIETLKRFESAILSVAAIEAIDLETKLGLAAEEIGDDLVNFLLIHAPRDPKSAVRRQIGLSDVVVGPAIKRWHAALTLKFIYGDAFNNQLNDRYKGKWDEYRQLSRDARASAMNLGVGLATSPIPRASVPQISSVVGTSPSATYYVQTAWTSGNLEGSPSPVTAFTTPAGSELSVNALNPPEIATGWNVYAGETTATVRLQNSQPLEIGASFVLPGLIDGRDPGDGQPADVFVISGRILQRG
jgi:hypothetical protein